jgi:Uma2 family endonuclease
MATGPLVSLEEYLHTSYHPDREYVDGLVLERILGEFDHSSLQTALGAYLFGHQKSWKMRALMGQRVHVQPTRIRVPDLCVLLEPGPFDQIIRTPPFICIEILSKNDTIDSMQERIDDYLAFGVRYVWLINPRSRRAFVYTADGSREAKDGILRTENPEIGVPLAEVFASLE